MPAKIHCAQHQLSLEHTAGSRLSYAQPVDAMKIEWKKSAVRPTRNSAAPLPRNLREAIEERLLAWPGPAVERRPEPTAFEQLIPTVRDRIKPTELDAGGGLALLALVHRFTAASIQALAAIGATSAYMQAERRGYSTFELALRVTGTPQSGDPVLVKTGIVHLGNSSIRFVHRISDPATGAEFARLGQFGVQLDLDSRRPAALPEHLRAAATRLLVPVG